MGKKSVIGCLYLRVFYIIKARVTAMSSMRQKIIRPAPSEISYKEMRFLITDRPTDQTIPNFIEELKTQREGCGSGVRTDVQSGGDAQGGHRSDVLGLRRRHLPPPRTWSISGLTCSDEAGAVLNRLRAWQCIVWPVWDVPPSWLPWLSLNSA